MYFVSADTAQLVERFDDDSKVAGSSPLCATIFLPTNLSGSEIYKMKNSSCSQRDSNSRLLDSEAIALTARLRRSDILLTC